MYTVDSSVPYDNVQYSVCVWCEKDRSGVPAELCFFLHVDEFVHSVNHPLHQLHFWCTYASLVGNVELSVRSFTIEQ